MYGMCIFQTVFDYHHALNFVDNLVSTKQQPQIESQQVPLSKIHQAFSKQMSIKELSKWLNSYPGIIAEYQEDIEKLRGIIVLYIATCMQ